MDARRINLRPRLEAIAAMAEGADVVADIGADHERLSMELLRRGARRVIASDVSPASLEKARALAMKCGVGDALSLVLSDGLTHLSQGEADAIIIAGMGGELIARILSSSPEVAHAASRLIMQPMGGAAELRAFLRQNGYALYEERIAYDLGRYYQLIGAKTGEEPPLPPGFPNDMLEFGPLLYQNRDPLLLPMLERCLTGRRRRMAKATLQSAAPAQLAADILAVEELIAAIKNRDMEEPYGS